MLTSDYVEYQYFFHFMPESIPLKHYTCVALFIFGCIRAFLYLRQMYYVMIPLFS
jgi:hypothetical protein